MDIGICKILSSLVRRNNACPPVHTDRMSRGRVASKSILNFGDDRYRLRIALGSETTTVFPCSCVENEYKVDRKIMSAKKSTSMT
mmetsp:Transcript_4955/g.11122  ORF Transcript_4955/g.11122 Transcript_4955/m.11122 type:complete len:85 (-) Transcript_4955:656-910(-)